MNDTAWKASKYEVFSGPNTGKYGSEKTSYLDTFYIVQNKQINEVLDDKANFHQYYFNKDFSIGGN